MRFELNSGGGYVEMFTSSYDRVRILVKEAFNESHNIYGLIKFDIEVSSDRYQAQQIQDLEECGFTLPSNYIFEEKIKEHEHDSEYILKEVDYLFPIEIDDTNCQALLWAVCAMDLGIQPKAAIRAYFIDFERKLVAHPYDDRGMDIVVWISLP